MRLYAIALTAASLAFLSACTSPPGEIDSDRRIDTAPDVAAPTSTQKTLTSPASRASTESSLSTSPTTESTSSTTTSETTASTPTSYMVHASHGIPGVIDCVGSPTKRPSSLSLSCSHTGDRLKDITWETWNETSAQGTAIRETKICGGTVCKTKDAKGQTSETEVKVELSAPTMTSQGPAFTLITVNGASIVL
ncbi:hypothetical protein [Corynebacterium sp.]|uniref:hypothetical protein n=1 Tax=Corynebacterium sp. TaxID=1720 RepID=UPI0026DC0663|nr:hypothetical protein [Corynebacterium sp.]MDO5076405.1 hypothetical protein [Corynebacterium sp.]